MATGPTVSKESVVVLFKGGRLPAWHKLTAEERRAYEQEHVDLMLSVARRHGLMRLEGFRLIGPQQPWERFWVVEFPTVEGAEAWTDAEMAPPYGVYGYYEYYLARRWGADHFSRWVVRPRELQRPVQVAHPGSVPPLDVDRSSVVVLLFGRGQPEHDATPAEQRGAGRAHRADAVRGQRARADAAGGLQAAQPAARLAPGVGYRVPHPRRR